MKVSVCFVSETARVDRPLLDPSVRYRCYHPAEAVVSDGGFATVLAAKAFYEQPFYDYDAYVFHRPNIAQPRFRQTLDRLAGLNRLLIADYDDLIFGGEDLALVSSAVKNRTLSPAAGVATFDANLSALRAFSRITVSTEPLARSVEQFHPTADVAVRPNRLPQGMLDVHREFGTAHRRRPRTHIGYFAGTKSHNLDLAALAQVLTRVLAENSDFHLLVVGPVELPAPLAALPNVTTSPVVDFWRLPSMMAACSTVIAPLERSPFNDCKSRAKFLEAAIAGCRLIATPIPDMSAIGEDHLVLASDSEAWYDALSNPPDAVTLRGLADRNLAFLAAQQDSSLVSYMAAAA